MSRRVVHFIDSELFGGAEQAVLTLLAGTDQRRWDTVLAHHPCPALAPLVYGAREIGVRTWSVPPMPPGPEGLRRLPHFIADLHRLSPAVVHLHLTWPLGCQYAQLGAFLARVPALVATVQLYVELALTRRVHAQQKLMTRAVDRYIAVSSGIRARLVRDLSWPAGKIEVIHNAVDSARMKREPDAALRASLGAREGVPLVLVPARLAPQKGQRDLLHAARQVPGAHFVFAGDGPDRETLKALAHELNLEPRTMFLGERRDVPSLLAASDIVVLPSLFEGLPLALLEAMASGKAVIASRIPGVDELITSGHDGLLVAPGEPDALATAIRTLLDHPADAERLGRQARATVESRFSSKVMCERVSEVYEELLAL